MGHIDVVQIARGERAAVGMLVEVTGLARVTLFLGLRVRGYTDAHRCCWLCGSQVAEKVEAGAEHITVAEKTQKRSQMFLCIIALIVIIVLLLIIVIIRQSLK